MSSESKPPVPPPLPGANKLESVPPSSVGGENTGQSVITGNSSVSSQSAEVTTDGTVAHTTLDQRTAAKSRVGHTVRGKWRLDKLLGIGGMASVYAATHRNGSRAALKILHPEFAMDEGLRARFVREGYVANRAEHPGRVAVLDDDVDDAGAPFLIMELLTGRTLRQRIKKEKTLPVLDALHIAAEVLDTLEPFHEQRVVHRDLKPGNIFLTKDGQVKLLDFGIAQLREAGTEATMAGTALGTPWFMAPEQAMSKSDALDGRADVFAIGATLHVALSGQKLWEGKNESQSFVLAATQPAPSIARVAPDLPVEVIAAVDKSLQWDPRNRFQTAGEMRDVLRGIIARLQAAESQPAQEEPGRRSIPPAVGAAVHPARQRLAQGRPGAGRVGQVTLPPGQAAATPSVPSTAPGRTSVPPPAAQDGVVPSMPGHRERASHTAGTVAEGETTKLDEVFRRMDRLLKAIRHYGIGHPDAAAKIHGLQEAMIAVLRVAPDGLTWEVQPYCFTHEGQTAWEPEPPADVIPYNLYVSGLKGVKILPGVTESELRTFCEIITLDPAQEADSGSVDIAGAIWEAGLAHIPCDISDDLGAFDAAEEEDFWVEADDVEALAREDLEGSAVQQDVASDISRAAAAAMVLDPMEMLAREDVAEAAAMSLAARGRAGSYATGPDALKIDAASATTMKAELMQSGERWRDRFLDLTVDALADASWRKDEQDIWDSFGSYARRLARGGALDELQTVYEGLQERLSAYQQEPVFAQSLPGLTSAMFGEGVLPSLASRAAGVPDDVAEPATANVTESPEQARALGTLRTVTTMIDSRACAEALATAQRLPEGPALDVVLEYLERHVAGNEQYFADQLERVEPRLAHRVVSMIHQTGTQAGVDLVHSLLLSPNPVLRCEAIAIAADSHDALRDQLLGMIDALDASVRRAAISTMVRHQVRAAGPGLVRAIEAENFGARSIDAQRDLLEALQALHPRRAEEITTAIVRKHGLMKDDALERTRILAAQLLGEWGESEAAIKGLQEATTRRWWNSAALRAEASKACHRVAIRVEAAKADGEGSAS